MSMLKICARRSRQGEPPGFVFRLAQATGRPDNGMDHMASGPREITRRPERANVRRPQGERASTEETPLERVNRDLAILNMRLHGLTFHEIARKLPEAGFRRVSVSRIYAIVAKNLRSCREQPARELRQLELLRLDQLQAAHYKAAMGGDATAVHASCRSWTAAPNCSASTPAGSQPLARRGPPIPVKSSSRSRRGQQRTKPAKPKQEVIAPCVPPDACARPGAAHRRERASFFARLDADELESLKTLWPFWARPEQLIPPGDWVFWLPLAGRGWGKTRTGAETVRHWAREFPLVNLIGATADDVRDVMVEGESGVLAICPRDERPRYVAHKRRLEWPNGAKSLLFSAEEPERLRGKQHMKLWCGRTRRLALSRSLGPGGVRLASRRKAAGDRHHHAASDQTDARSARRSADLFDAAFDLRKHRQSRRKFS